MDEHVLRGVARWPDVPAVYGWLTLDRRGNWLIRGTPVRNAVFEDYIGRNYEHDSEGRFFFQNGPQRVFVALDYTPVVYRVVSNEGAALAIESHTGSRAASISGAWIDESGAMLVESELGIGLVDDRDLDRLLPFLIDANGTPLPEQALDDVMVLFQQGREAPVWLKFGESNVRVEPIRTTEVASRFRFDAEPREPQRSQA